MLFQYFHTLLFSFSDIRRGMTLFPIVVRMTCSCGDVALCGSWDEQRMAWFGPNGLPGNIQKGDKLHP